MQDLRRRIFAEIENGCHLFGCPAAHGVVRRLAFGETDPVRLDLGLGRFHRSPVAAQSLAGTPLVRKISQERNSPMAVLKQMLCGQQSLLVVIGIDAVDAVSDKRMVDRDHGQARDLQKFDDPVCEDNSNRGYDMRLSDLLEVLLLENLNTEALFGRQSLNQRGHDGGIPHGQRRAVATSDQRDVRTHRPLNKTNFTRRDHHTPTQVVVH